MYLVNISDLNLNLDPNHLNVIQFFSTPCVVFDIL